MYFECYFPSKYQFRISKIVHSKSRPAPDTIVAVYWEYYVEVLKCVCKPIQHGGFLIAKQKVIYIQSRSTPKGPQFIIMFKSKTPMRAALVSNASPTVVHSTPGQLYFVNLCFHSSIIIGYNLPVECGGRATVYPPDKLALPLLCNILKLVENFTQK